MSTYLMPMKLYETPIETDLREASCPVAVLVSLLELELSADLLLFSGKKNDKKNLITLLYCSCRRSKSAEKAAKAGWMDGCRVEEIPFTGSMKHACLQSAQC